MKKYIRYVVLVIGLALFIFLMLPFLTTPEKPGTSSAAAQKPQIFTSNPLTAIARKLWSKLSGQSARPGLSSANSPELAQRAAAKGQPGKESGNTTLLASRFKTQPAGEQEETPANDPDMENARFFLQDDNGEWVLIRQRAPEASLAGMHEISIKEDAYDRYVKQERNARFTPTARTTQTDQVPDSKWASLVAPVKRFLGFDNAQAAQTGPLLASGSADTSARRSPSAPSNNTGGTSASGRSASLPYRAAPSQLISLINPFQIIKESADLVANSTQDETKREEIRRTQQEEYQQYVQHALQEQLAALAGDEVAQDQLPKTLDCDSDKGMIREDNASACNREEKDATEEIKAKNRNTFRELTGMELPDTALVPVLGIADPASVQSIDPEYATETDLMYAFMLEQNNCQKGGCFWVANAKQSVKILQPSIEAAGVSFVGDPLGKFPQLKEDFVAEQMRLYEKQNPQATQEEKQKREENLRKAAPPHIFYTQEDMTTLLAQLQPGATDKTQAEGEKGPTPVLYLPDAADAKAFADQYGYDVPFVFGRQQHLVFSESEGTTMETRSDIVTRDLAAHVNLMQGLIKHTQQDAAGKAVQNTFAPINQNIQAQAAEDLKRFDQNSGLSTR